MTISNCISAHCKYYTIGFVTVKHCHTSRKETSQKKKKKKFLYALYKAHGDCICNNQRWLGMALSTLYKKMRLSN
jgi:transcriptional regulator of acetoin/glycerol metabolism